MKKSDSKSSASEVQRQVAHCYSTWGKTYFKDYYRSASAYPPVHLDIVRNELRRHGACNVLDAGCGPASMLRGLKQLGTRRFGFDLTPGMVEEAQKVLARQGVPANHIWQGSVLRSADFTRPNLPSNYAAAVCFGVLPHIPANQDETVLRNLYQVVSPGGLVLVEARNALFSLFTQNRYTYEFICNDLIRAKDLVSKNEAFSEAISKNLEEFKLRFRMDLPTFRKGKKDEPGYDEVLSRTHVPFILQKQFQKAGFRDIKTLFYHFHVLPPMFAAATEKLFERASLEMEKPEDWRGYFMASAFITLGKKP